MTFKTFNAHATCRKLICFSCFTILFWAACSEKEERVEKIQHYGTGEVSRRYYEINGKKAGKMTDYYPDGLLKSESSFENGKQVGRTVIYFPSGKIKEVQYYEEGLKQGGDTIWYEDGKPQFVVQFNKGKKDGYLRKWAPDGSLTYEAKFENETLVEVKGKPIHHSDTQLPPADTTEQKNN